MNAQTEIPLDHPMRAAWEAHKLTDEYRNALRWAIDGEPEHVVGSLWAMFVVGWNAQGSKLEPRTNALRAFVAAAKSWHDFHHGSKDIQCDALCECIPAAEEALK